MRGTISVMPILFADRRLAIAPGLLLAIVLAVPLAPAGAETAVRLKNASWEITIRPETLQVSARAVRSPLLMLSAARSGSGPVAHLERRAESATWELPADAVTVSMRLEGDTLQAHFLAAKAGAFTWPILGRDPSVRGYILPTFEGVYAPAGDPRWIDFLVERGAMDTTADFSMPFWGIDCGDRTLTYILTNPFNNEIAFRGDAGRLAAQLTHSFTRNRTVKEFGVEISLGPGSPTEPAKRYRRWLVKQGQFVRMAEKIRKTPDAAKLMGAAHVYLWGDGVSSQMMQTFAADGFDRLWLGSDGWQRLRDNPEAIRTAKALGYLIASYDSYHSIHHPQETETWETAQFDQKLYETGAVVQANGKPKAGFQRKGYALSPLAARPYVEKRVAGLMEELHCNSWFIDCDAFGELFDDYSPLHPATQEDDMNARLSRMAWIRDTYHLVIGSEGGSAYAASTVHFAHGMMTPSFGWGDPELHERTSKYYLGAYFPADGPAVFLRPVPLKERYRTFYCDPRSRLPLYETVFHDSVVTTHHWSYGTLKFPDAIRTRALLELLYQVPPLYHINQREFARHKAWMVAQYAFFSPLHRETALLPMTGFAWLTPDRLVQRTAFGEQIELVANFRSEGFADAGVRIPPQSILARWKKTGKTRIFTPDGDPANAGTVGVSISDH
jgi:hypothetical protein